MSLEYNSFLSVAMLRLSVPSLAVILLILQLAEVFSFQEAAVIALASGSARSFRFHIQPSFC